MNIKKILKRFLPTPMRSFEWAMEKINRNYNEQSHQLAFVTELAEKINSAQEQEAAARQQEFAELKNIATQMEAMQIKQQTFTDLIEKVSSAQIQEAAARQQEFIEHKEISMQSKLLLEKVVEDSRGTDKILNEIVWSEVFKDTISGSTWLANKSFSLGRWAAGYPFLYALYRTIDSVKPVSILELGLGQTTKMMAQYVAQHKEVQHIVVEHDASWIDFFKTETEVSERTGILHLELGEMSFKSDDKVVCYQSFNEHLQGKKFDLICVDGPFGYAADVYARMDILSLLPECLSKSFCIFVDDADRRGEQNTIYEICTLLSEHQIPYKRGHYAGSKRTEIVVSLDNAFLCSM
ncbi:MAG: hypothetical protein ACK5MN_04010 [Lachnospiraceae bacterium]